MKRKFEVQPDFLLLRLLRAERGELSTELVRDILGDRELN
jgi:hypothetical protein